MSNTIVVPQSEVPALLPMDACIDAMERALSALAREDAVLPLRNLLRLPQASGILGLMPAYLGDPRSVGIKVVTVFAGNHGTDRDSHQGAVLLFDTTTGSLSAVIDASSITAIRTAAVSGLATRLLAREDAGDLAIIGTGVQASAHLDAMRAVRKLRRVRVCGKRLEGAREFAEHHAASMGMEIEAVETAERAVEGADIVCTATSSAEPILRGAWLGPGAHVNAVGACFPTSRELDSEAVVKSRLIVDRRESAMNEAGDFLIPKREGLIGDDHIAGELGEILIGRVPGRRSPAEITLFKSLGIAVEDLAAAELIDRNARRSGRGIAIDFGGHRRAYD